MRKFFSAFVPQLRNIQANRNQAARKLRLRTMLIEQLEDKRLLAINILDDSHPGFVLAGAGWGTSNSSIATGGSHRMVAGGTGTSTAEWKFPNIDPGTYEVFARWVNAADRASNARYKILSNNGELATYSVNQKNPSGSNAFFSSLGFSRLGTSIVVTANDLTVRLDNSGSGTVSADAVVINRLSNADALTDRANFTGSESYATSAKTQPVADNLIPVSLDRSYQMSLVARSGNGTGGQYNAAEKHSAGFTSFDNLNNIIVPQNYRRVPGSADTTLAQPLTPGARKIYLNSIAGWYNGTDPSQRAIAWYGPHATNGQTYSAYGYTQNVRYDLTHGTWGANAINAAEKSITLSPILFPNGWTGPSLNAGSPVRNASGLYASNNYNLLSDSAVGPNWTNYVSRITGVNTADSSDYTKFLPGTAYIRPFFFANQSNLGGNLLAFKNFDLTTLPSRAFRPGEKVELNVEPLAGASAPRAYMWYQISGASVTLEQPAGNNVATFIAPTLPSAEKLTFEVRTNNASHTLVDKITVDILPKAEAIFDTALFSGSEVYATTASQYVVSSTAIPVSVDRGLQFNVLARSGNGSGGQVDSGAKHSIGFVPFDSLGTQILPYHYRRYPGSSDTRLAQPLDPGDTVVYLNSVNGWANSAGPMNRGLAWYGDNKNGNGQVFAEYGYTQNVVFDPVNGAWNVGGIDATANTITLRTPWAGPVLPVGAAVRNASQPMESINYNIMFNQTIGTSWTNYSGIVNDVNDADGGDLTKFFPGTAFVRPAFIANNVSTTGGNLVTLKDFEVSPLIQKQFRPSDRVELNIDPLQPVPIGTTYTWTQTSGPTVTLNAAGTTTPWFTAPDTQNSTQLSFRIVASDGLNSWNDSVSVNVTSQSPINILGVSSSTAPASSWAVDYAIAAGLQEAFAIEITSSLDAVASSDDVVMASISLTQASDLAAGSRSLTIPIPAELNFPSGNFYLLARAVRARPTGLEIIEFEQFKHESIVTAEGTLFVFGSESADDIAVEHFTSTDQVRLSFSADDANSFSIVDSSVPITDYRILLYGGADKFRLNVARSQASIVASTIYTGSGDDAVVLDSTNARIVDESGLDATTLFGSTSPDYVDVTRDGVRLGGEHVLALSSVEKLSVKTLAGDDRIDTADFPLGVSELTLDADLGTDSLRLSKNGVGLPGTPTSARGFENLDMSEHRLLAISSSDFSFLGTDKSLLRELDLRYNLLNLAIGTTLAPVKASLPGLTKLYLYGNPNGDINTDLSGIAGTWFRTDLAPVGLGKAEALDDSQTVFPAIAKALHYSPLAVFEYLVNNFTYEPYAGRMKDAVSVIQTRAANDYDMANLLRELLFRCGIVESQIRFVRNKLGDAYTYLDAPDARQWIGTTPAPGAHQEAVLAFMNLEGRKRDTYSVYAGSTFSGIGFDHVWLEVNAGGFWVPMAPAYKKLLRTSVVDDYLASWNLQLGTNYTNFAELLVDQVPANPGVPGELSTLLPNDTHPAAYYSQKIDTYDVIGTDYWYRYDDLSAADWYEARVSNWLAVNAPGISIADVRESFSIIPRQVNSISETWPRELKFLRAGSSHTIVPYESAIGTLTETFVPGGQDLWRVSIQTSHTVMVNNQPVDDPLWNVSVTIPEIGRSSLSVRRGSGDYYSRFPNLFVEGQQRTLTSSSTLVPNEKYKLTIRMYPPYSDALIDEDSRSFDLTDVVGIGFDANQISDLHYFNRSQQVSQRMSAVMSSASAMPPTALLTAYTPSDIQQFLTVASETYWRKVRDSNDRMGSMLRIRAMQTVSWNFFYSKESVYAGNTLGSAEFPIQLTNLTLDVKRRSWRGYSRNAYDESTPFPGSWSQSKSEAVSEILTSLDGSFHESGTIQQLTGNHAFSTIVYLLIARKLGFPIQRFTKSEWNAYKLSPNFPFPNQVSSDVDQTLNEPGVAWILITPDTWITQPGRLQYGGAGAQQSLWQGIGWISHAADGGEAYWITPISGAYVAGGSATMRSVVPIAPANPIPKLVSDNVGDPVNVYSGAFIEDVLDIEIPSVGLPLTFARHYNSSAASKSGKLAGVLDLGSGWWHNYSDRLYFPNAGSIEWIDSFGHQFTITLNNGTYIVPSELKGEFWFDTGVKKYFYRDRGGLARRFTDGGKLDAIMDQYGNELRLEYVNDRVATVTSLPITLSGLPMNATDTKVAQRIAFEYDANGKIKRINQMLPSGAIGRSWLYSVGQVQSGSGIYLLTRVETPAVEVNGTFAPRVTSYTYSTSSASTPYARLKDIIQSDQSTTRIDYYWNGRVMQVSIPDRGSQRFVYDAVMGQTIMYDENFHATRYTYNKQGNTTHIRYPDGATKAFEWDAVKQQLRYERDEGNLVRSYSYTTATGVSVPFDSPSKIDTQYITSFNANGTPTFGTYFSETTEYESIRSNGRLIVQHPTKTRARSDATGAIVETTYLYDAVRPQNLVKIVEGGLRASYLVRHASGLVIEKKMRSWTSTPGSLTSPSDDNASPLMEREGYVYNNAGQVVQTTSDVSNLSGVVSAIVEKSEYDVHGFLRKKIDGKGVTTSTITVDALGTVTNVTAPATANLASQTATWIHNSRGDVIRSVDFANRTKRTRFDAQRRPLQITHADGSFQIHVYDGAGNLISQTDEAGRITRFDYDSRNRLSAVHTPDSTSEFFVYDARGNQVHHIERLQNLGYVIANDDSSGHFLRESKRFYDARGLLVVELMPDPDGNTQTIDVPTTLYQYNIQGQLTATVDPRASARPWQNAANPFDVNNDGSVTQVDADEVSSAITTLSYSKTASLPFLRSSGIGKFVDVNGDGNVSAEDRQAVLNRMAGTITVQPVVGTSFLYDTLGRILKKTEPNSFGGLTIDTTMNHAAPAWQFQYDLPIAGLSGSPNIGFLEVVIDPLMRKESHVFDGRGREWTTITQSPSGQEVRRVSQSYDGADQVVATIEARGYQPGSALGQFTTTYVYDERGNRISTDQPNTIDASGNTLNHLTTFTYDQVGNRLSSSIGLARTDYVYDSRDRQIEVRRTIASGSNLVSQRVRQLYNNLGLVVQDIDPLGRVDRYMYDTRDRLIASINVLGDPTILARTSTGKIRSTTRPNGSISSSYFDANDREISSHSIDPDGPGPQDSVTTATDYNRAGEVVQIRTRDSSQSLDRTRESRSYDRLGRLIEWIQPDPDWVISGSGPNSIATNGPLTAPSHVYRYDAVGNLVQGIDPRRAGIVNGDSLFATDYTYDALNRLITVTQPDNDFNPMTGINGPLGRPVWQYTYDWNGNRVSEIDPVNRKTKWQYDALGLLEKTEWMTTANDTVPQAVEQRFYDDRGNLIKSIDPNNIATAYSYDLMDRRIAINEADVVVNGVTQTRESIITYDLVGNVSAFVDPLGRTNVYEYDGLNRETVVRQASLDSDQRRSVTFYDRNGNGIGKIDSLGRLTQFTFDLANRQTAVREATGETTTFAYDTYGNRESVVDPRGVKTLFQYDSLDRLLSEGLVDGPGANAVDWRRFEYDAAGNRIKQTDRSDRVVEFQYDLLNRNVKEIWKASPTAVPVANQIQTSYDLAGQVISQVDQYASATFGYDYAGRKLTESNLGTTGFPVVTLTTSYFANGLRSGLQTSAVHGTSTLGSHSLSFTLDMGGRWASIRDGATNTILVDFQYNSADQRTKVTRYGADVLIESNYEFDTNSGRLASIQHGNRASSTGQLTLVDSYRLQQDRQDRITEIDAFYSGLAKFQYDARDQLTSANRVGSQQDELFAYDASGNRTTFHLGSQSTPATYGTSSDQNRVLMQGDFTFTYDREGNMTSRSKTGEHVAYQWDLRNRLTRVEFRTAAGSALTKTVAFVYDAQNRLIQEIIDPDGNAATANSTSRKFAYDGQDLIYEFNTANQLTHRYLHGPSVDEVLMDEDFSLGTSDQRRWLLSDHLNSVRSIESDKGVLLERRDYGAFGQTIVETNETAQIVDELFGYTGRPFFESVQLQNNRARWYSPTLGRFISTDPTGFAGGDYNLYRYTANDPINQIDPSGEKATNPSSTWLSSRERSTQESPVIHARKMSLWETAVRTAHRVVRMANPLLGMVENAGREASTVWGNTADFGTVNRIYTTGGTVAAGFVGIRDLDDAFQEYAAVDAHRQTTSERVIKGVSGTVSTVTTVLPVAKGLTGALASAQSSSLGAIGYTKRSSDATSRVTGMALEDVRRAFKSAKPQAWIDEAAANASRYTAAQLERMKKGLAPIGDDGFSMEIHHRIPLAEGGTNDFSNFEFLTKTLHRLGENYKLNHPNLP